MRVDQAKQIEIRDGDAIESDKHSLAAPLSLAHNLSIVVVALGLVLTAWIPAMLPWLPLPAGVLEMALGAGLIQSFSMAWALAGASPSPAAP